MFIKRPVVLIACLGFIINPALSKDIYYALALKELTFPDRALPTPSETHDAVNDLRYNIRQTKEAFIQPYAIVDREAEVYLRAPERRAHPWFIRRSMASNIDSTRILLRASEPQGITGTLYLPKADWSGMQAYAFEVPRSVSDHTEARREFLEAKGHYYRTLLEQTIPGSPWFRHQIQQARDANDTPTPAPRGPGQTPISESELQRTYALFSGGRALSENLQLDRALQVTAQNEPNVPLDSLTGITVTEIDWKLIVKDLAPAKDPLAGVIPADQHVLFFPSFTAMATLVDEAKAHGTPILHLVDPRSEDAMTHERYEKQLCLSLDAWARLLGPRLIDSLALTGSDPYLRTGSDVALLFETTDAATLPASIRMQYQRVQAQDARVQSVSGSILGHSYHGVVKADRSICSYLVTWDKVVLVTNSLVQMEKILKAKSGRGETLLDLDEYTFFRDRYKRGEPESALLIITDAAIRRWCSPRWRIGTSRRVRAAAVMAGLQARHMETLVGGLPEDQRRLEVDTSLDMGTLALTPQGVTCERYGTLAFQTPVAELAFTKVTQAEARAYRRYRNLYQRRWQQFFDPIAIRFTVQPGKANRIAMDLTVRPLIASSEYRDYVDITGNHGITDQAGDPHEEALGQVIFSIDRNAEEIQKLGNMAATIAPGLRANPLAWLGDWLTLYVDQDPFWPEFQTVAAQGSDRAMGEFMETNMSRLPVALHVDVGHSLKLAGFLVSARAVIEQTVPGMTVWDNQVYKEQAYVRIRPAERTRGQSDMLQDLALYYVVTPEALVVSLSETLIKRAIDRQASSDEGAPPAGETHTWLGQSVAAHIQGPGMTMVQTLFNHNAMDILRKRSWGNLVILNEWRRRFGDPAPLALHQRLWQTRLVCPGGGQYVWNEAYQTMESTVFGCPARPKIPESIPNALTSLKDINLGVTFEEDGLRARVEVQR
jgi:hypothetical protein